MSEFGGLWKHENDQHALVPPKTECDRPSGGGIKHGHVRYPSYGGTQKKRGMEPPTPQSEKGHPQKEYVPRMMEPMPTAYAARSVVAHLCNQSNIVVSVNDKV